MSNGVEPASGPSHFLCATAPYSLILDPSAPGFTVGGWEYKWEPVPPVVDELAVVEIKGKLYVAWYMSEEAVRLRCPLWGGRTRVMPADRVLGKVTTIFRC